MRKTLTVLFVYWIMIGLFLGGIGAAVTATLLTLWENKRPVLDRRNEKYKEIFGGYLFRAAVCAWVVVGGLYVLSKYMAWIATGMKR